MRALFAALLQNKADFLRASQGGEFEDRVIRFMRDRMRLTRIQKTDITDWRSLSELTKEKLRESKTPNIYDTDDSFIYQPNGSQNYPDFAVFIGGEVVCIETKYAKPPRPVWNSGLPRPNGFYILGSPKIGDITFFRGCDVVTLEEGRRMHDFFASLKNQEERFNRDNLGKQAKGFGVYIRKAFQQGKQYNPDADTNYYESKDRERFERNVLNYFSGGD